MARQLRLGWGLDLLSLQSCPGHSRPGLFHGPGSPMGLEVVSGDSLPGQGYKESWPVTCLFVIRKAAHDSGVHDAIEEHGQRVDGEAGVVQVLLYHAVQLVVGQLHGLDGVLQRADLHLRGGREAVRPAATPAAWPLARAAAFLSGDRLCHPCACAYERVRVHTCGIQEHSPERRWNTV